MSSLINAALNNHHLSVLDTSRNVKPEQPKGYLVKTPLYMAPVEYVKDFATDAYGIVKGIKGKANDHELGKQNDVAMKLGGLAIASYLCAFRPSKLPKIMEFVGLGSFFTSMALWPKLAIALPLKMRTGVDIQQKYVDSYGRKKKFFQDNQYLPWDLYSKEEIQKLGDKMKVPYDVPNRDEVVQEKARKMAVQGNTLWLATAGFATPIMTGLICKGLEPVVDNLKQKYELYRTDKLMDGQTWFPTSNSAPKSAKAAFESFLADNMGKEIDSANPELLERLNWSPLRECELDSVLKRDLAKILDNFQGDVKPDYATKIYERFADILGNAGITQEEVSTAFKNNKFLGNQKELIKRYRTVNPKTTAVGLGEATSEVLNGLLTQKLGENQAAIAMRKINDDAISNIINGINRKVLDEKTAGTLRNVFDELSGFFKRALTLREWEKAHYVTNADSSIASTWKKFPKAVLSALEVTPEELDLMGKEGSKTEKILEEKITKLVSDPEKYKKAVSKIADSIAEFDTINNAQTRSRYRGFVDSLTSTAKRGLKAIGFDYTAEYIGGRELKTEGGKIVNFIEAMSGTINHNRKTAFDNNVLNTKASLYRFIQLLDMHKRINDYTMELQLRRMIDPDVRIKDVIRESKKLIMNGGTDAHVNKLDGRVGERTYQAIMRLLYGALPDNAIREEVADLSSNMAVRKAIFEGFDKGVEEGCNAAIQNGIDKVKVNFFRTGLAPETIEALYDSSARFGKKTGKSIDLLENYRAYTQTFIDKVVNTVGNFCDFGLKGQKLPGVIQNLSDGTSPKLTSALIGTEPTKIMRTAAQEISNNRRWIRKFGIAGTVLLAGTMLTTLFFGYIPKKDMYMKDDKNNVRSN